MIDNDRTPLDDKTTIRLTISSWWHVVIIVGVIVAAYVGLKADTEKAITISKDTAAKQESMQSSFWTMREDIRSVTDDVKWFRQQYERDQQREAVRTGRIR